MCTTSNIDIAVRLVVALFALWLLVRYAALLPGYESFEAFVDHGHRSIGSPNLRQAATDLQRAGHDQLSPMLEELRTLIVQSG